MALEVHSHFVTCQPAELMMKTLNVRAGIVGVVQYHHTEMSARKTPRKGSAGSRDAGSEYELVLAVSSIRAQVYGEDFQDFMHRGATQCSSFHAYMDLFCYQAPASRSAAPDASSTLSSFCPHMSVPAVWPYRNTAQATAAPCTCLRPMLLVLLPGRVMGEPAQGCGTKYDPGICNMGRTSSFALPAAGSTGGRCRSSC